MSFESLQNAFTDALRFVSGKQAISEKNINEAVEQIKMALLDADVSLRVVRRFVNQTAEEALGEKVLRGVNPGEQFVKIVHDKLCAFLGGGAVDLVLKGRDTLSVILLLGLQGSGKTTTSAKLATRLKNEGRKVLLAACDLERPAAVEQLRVLSESAGVGFYSEDGAKDIAKVFSGARFFAEKNGFDTLIVDTAGRMHVDGDLMERLSNLAKIAKPDEALLVCDSMTGQAAADIAKSFDAALSLTGVILSKFDSDARGGAALSIKTITGKPVKFVGTGEKLSDLELFHPDRAAGRILGMGDVVSLVEKAQGVVSQKEAEELQKKIRKETLTLADYLSQIQALKKMGSLKSVLEMMPGMAGKIDEEALETEELKVHEAILLSMTLKERDNYLIVGPSRRARIARGSGRSVAEVARLLKKFEKMRSMMKKASKGLIKN